MRIHTLVKAAVFVTALSWAAATWAEDESLGEGLVIREDGGIAHVSGGIGGGQQEALARASSRFNLKLTMATKDGKYIGQANIRIRDKQGRSVLSTVSDGPLFFAKLPAGNYHVEASAEGRSLSQDVTVPAEGQKQVVLTWPYAAEDHVQGSDRFGS
jgi:hypothetical protein